MDGNHIKKSEFRAGDWVSCRIIRTSEQGKLKENWQCTYIVGKIQIRGAYILCTLEGELLEYP